MPTDVGVRPRILAVEDDERVRGLVARVLGEEGYRVVEAEDALAAIQALEKSPPDLVLLDINLPGIDGLELLNRIRRSNNIPIIMLTGRSNEQDRINGLRSGADDYIAKPFSPGELLARIETVLRRAASQSDIGAGKPSLSFDGLSIDLGTRDVTVDDVSVDMTAKEFDLLVFLASSPRQVFSREQILQQVWGSSSDWQDPATVTEHIRRVRRKVERVPDEPRWIHTVRGAGYRFQP